MQALCDTIVVMDDENIYYRVAKRVIDENNQMKYVLVVFLSLVLIDYLTVGIYIMTANQQIIWFSQGIKVLYLIRAIGNPFNYQQHHLKREVKLVRFALVLYGFVLGPYILLFGLRIALVLV